MPGAAQVTRTTRKCRPLNFLQLEHTLFKYSINLATKTQLRYLSQSLLYTRMSCIGYGRGHSCVEREPGRLSALQACPFTRGRGRTIPKRFCLAYPARAPFLPSPAV